MQNPGSIPMAIAALSLLACGGSAPTPTAKPSEAKPAITGAKTGPFKAQAKLQWMPDATWILVDGHLRFEPATGAFSPVNGTRAGQIPTLGPAGERAYIDATSVRVGPDTVPIPQWIEGDGADREALGYWADSERIYVQQFTKSRSACRVLNLTSKQWRVAAAECFDPGQWFIESIQAGPGRLVHTYASNDGAPDIRIGRYDPRQGQGEVMLKLKATADEVPIVTFTADGGTARVVTTCAQPDGPCGQKPALYHFDLYDKESLRVGPVDAGAVPAPDGDLLVWVHHGALCVGKAGGPAKCHAP